MALINSNQCAPFSFHLPIYTSPVPLGAAPIIFEHESRFEHDFAREFANLYERRAQLSSRLAMAKRSSPNAVEKQEILKEYVFLEYSNKFLKLLVDATEKSRQGLAANLR